MIKCDKCGSHNIGIVSSEKGGVLIKCFDCNNYLSKINRKPLQ